MNIKIVIATHKLYPMPTDPLYLPLHVGKASSDKKLPYQTDHTGFHISSKNSHYCELTALYWAWKNLDADYIGLVHYRRHFSVRKPWFFCKNKFPYVLSEEEAQNLIKEKDILLPKKRNYYIETNYSHYVHAHDTESIERTRQIIKRLYPEYETAFRIVMNDTKAHMFNMFIMKKNHLDAYCHFLFSVLFALEEELGMTEKNKRLYGFISELLLDVYLKQNQLPYQEIDYMFMENEHWVKKIYGFLKRKFIKK